MNCTMLGFPVLRYLPEFAQTQVHWVGDAIQPSHPLLPPSPPALSLPQYNSSNCVAIGGVKMKFYRIQA